MIQQRLRRLEVLVERLAAALRGSAAAPLPRPLQTARDVIALLQEQVEAIRAAAEAGAVEKARAIGYLAGIARRVIEMSRRVEHPERGQASGVSIWDVICGARDLEDLDDVGQARLRRLLDDAGQTRETIEERIIALLNPAVPAPPRDDDR
jgi:hypothetical protein